jgi:hypothetical protein
VVRASRAVNVKDRGSLSTDQKETEWFPAFKARGNTK